MKPEYSGHKLGKISPLPLTSLHFFFFFSRNGTIQLGIRLSAA